MEIVVINQKLEPITVQSPYLNFANQKELERIHSSLQEERNLSQEKALKSLEDLFCYITAIKPESKEEAAAVDRVLIWALGRYGSRTYPKFNDAISYLTSALQMQLQQFDHLNLNKVDFSDYLKVKEFLHARSYPNLINLLLTTDSKNYPELLKGLSDEEKFHFAEAAYNLGQSFCHLKDKVGVSQEVYPQFMDNYWKGVNEIFVHLHKNSEGFSSKGRFYLGEIQYNIFSAPARDKCDGENVTKEMFLEAFKELEKALEYNDSQSMKARIANLEACMVYEYDLSWAKELSQKSLSLWNEVLKDYNNLPESDVDQFSNLYWNASSTYLAILMKEGSKDIQEMEKLAANCLKFYETYKDVHPYCMGHLIAVARVEIVKGNTKAAEYYLDLSEKLSEKWKTWPHTKDYLTKIFSVKGQIIQICLEKERTLSRPNGLKSLEELFYLVKGLKPQSPEQATQVTKLLISVVGRYGNRMYPRFDDSIRYITSALQMQLQQLDHLKLDKVDYSSLTTLQDFSRVDFYPNLIDVLHKTDPKDYPAMLKGFSDEEKFHFAQSAYNLIQSYFNLKEKSVRMSQEEYSKFMVSFAEGINQIYLSLKDNPKMKSQVVYELGELQYNIFAVLEMQKCSSKETLLEAFKVLEKALDYNPSESMKARIWNLKGKYIKDYDIGFEKEYFEKGVEAWKKVMEEYKNFTEFEKDWFTMLQCNTMNNYLGVLLKEECKNIQAMEELALYSLHFYETYKDVHPYCMGHLINLALVEIAKGCNEEAKKYLEFGEALSKSWQSWPDTKKYLERIAAIRKELSEIKQ